MKKISMLAILAAALLCLGMTIACNRDGDQTSDTSVGTAVTDAVTDVATGDATGAATDAATEAEATVEDTEAVTELDTDGADTEAATQADTQPEETTEAVTRYDYFAAEVLPDVSVEKKDYESLTLELPSDLKVTEDDVQDFILQLRYERKTAKNGTTQVKDQALKLGDMAYIYYEGKMDGVAFDGGSNMEDDTPYGLGLGSGAFIPGFEEGLVGVVPNTTSKESPFELHVTFPESYGNAELAGKAVIFYVVVEYAVQYDLPEYNRDFVETTLQWTSEKTHITDASFLAEFEEYLMTYLESQNESYVESAKTEALWEYLTANIKCRNLPESEVKYYLDSYVSEVTDAYEYYSAYGGEEFAKNYPTIGDFAIAYLGFAKGADWEAEIAKQAENMVKKDMIVHAIAELEGVETVTDEDFEKEVQYWVDYYSGYGVTREDVIENMGEDYLRESAFAVKMDELLMGNVTFVFAGDSENAEDDSAETAEDAA